MQPFGIPDPTTFSGLLDILRDEALPYHAMPDDLHEMSSVSSRIPLLLSDYSSITNCHSCGHFSLTARYTRLMISDLEALGVRGWVQLLEADRLQGVNDELEQLLDMSYQQVECLQEREKVLEDLVESTMERIEVAQEHLETAKQRLRVAREQVAIVMRQNGNIHRLGEGNVELRDVIEQVERLARLNLAKTEVSTADTTSSRPPTTQEHTRLSEIVSEACVNETSSIQMGTNYEKPRRRPRLYSMSSTSVEMGSSGFRSPSARIIDAGLDSDLAHLPLLTVHSEQEDDDRNAKRLEEENAIWSHKQDELQYSLIYEAFTPSPDHRSQPSVHADIVPSHIFIPLLANFTLPQHNAHLPSLTFNTPPSVVHFPDGTKKDQILTALRQRSAAGLPIPDLEPLEGINSMQVRTHHMEWQLKNAIRKNMTQEEWDTNIGKQWYTDGKGDTYIVSKTDVYSHGVSSTALVTPSGARADEESMNGNATQESDAEEEPPHLRGGASSPTSEDRERLSLAALTSGAWAFEISDHYGEVQDNVEEANACGFQKACIEDARALQLENASHARTIERLQDIVKDLEETFAWQDNALDTMYRRSEHWKHEAMSAKEDADAARKEAIAARTEADELNAIMEDINEQIGSFYEQLDGQLGDIERGEDSREWTDSNAPEIRGGAGCTGTEQTFADPDEDESPPDIDAKTFIFFPKIPVMVLLTKPLRYFHWPRGTTLHQARDVLRHRHVSALETDPFLNHIREIMDLRADMGMLLPDSDDHRQIAITLPSFEQETEDEWPSGRGSE
jgi:hypothetical protein